MNVSFLIILTLFNQQQSTPRSRSWLYQQYFSTTLYRPYSTTFCKPSSQAIASRLVQEMPYHKNLAPIHTVCSKNSFYRWLCGHTHAPNIYKKLFGQPTIPCKPYCHGYNQQITETKQLLQRLFDQDDATITVTKAAHEILKFNELLEKHPLLKHTLTAQLQKPSLTQFTKDLTSINKEDLPLELHILRQEMSRNLQKLSAWEKSRMLYALNKKFK